MGIAIVTGASAGLGAEFSKQLDKEGYDKIWLIARREERLIELSNSLKSQSEVITCNLLDSKDIEEKITKKLESEKVDVSLLVNCAGFGKIGAFEDLDINDMTTMIDLNCRAVVQLSHIVLPYMKKGSSLIHVSSTASFVPLGGFAVYAATKAFVTSFSIALQSELVDRGIHSIAVCPGPVNTEFSKVAHNGSTREDTILKTKVTPAPVVKKALRDCKKRKSLSIYGFKFRLAHFFSKLIPSYTIARGSFKQIMGRDKIGK